MSRCPYPALFAVALLAGGCMHPAHAETKVSCDTVPAAVLRQAKIEAPDALVRGCVKEKEHGKLTYEVETIHSNKSKDMTFDSQGTLMEVEQEVDRDSLPAAVSGAIAKASHGGEVGRVESVIRDGAVKRYETTITRKGRRHEVAFAPEGTPMKAD